MGETPPTYSDVLRQFYSGSEFVLSTEGILKFISIVLCLVSCVVFMAGGVCATSRGLVPTFPIAVVMSAISIAITYIGAIMRCGRHLPQVWLYFNIILSTAAGILMLVIAVVTMSVCSNTNAIDLIPGPIAILTSVLVIVSVAVTYISSTRRWNNIEKTKRKDTLDGDGTRRSSTEL